MKLSVNILTYKGEFLDKAIASVRPYADEVIVKDTAAIQHLGKAWTNSPLDIELTRLLNEMKDESKGGWILKVDDDEIFTTELMEEIMKIVRSDDDTPIYAIPFRHVGTSSKKRYIKRLFRNIEDVSWNGNYGWETLAYQGKRISSNKCPKLNNFFYHLGGLRKEYTRKHDYSTLQ
ncbi:MAG: hypothetical protein A2Y41_13915 [Spirochaetes bacterium GWB1_36_13]|nr:MAG: hypothetical protein A2Y41_13915 [Spirochaetes bacterium GWB1_36_13]